MRELSPDVTESRLGSKPPPVMSMLFRRGSFPAINCECSSRSLPPLSRNAARRRTSFYTETCYGEGEGEGARAGERNRFCHFPVFPFPVLPSENYDVDEAQNISRKQWRRARISRSPPSAIYKLTDEGRILNWGPSESEHFRGSILLIPG